MSELVRIGLARGNSSHQASMQLPTLITYSFKDFLPFTRAPHVQVKV